MPLVPGSMIPSFAVPNGKIPLLLVVNISVVPSDLKYLVFGLSTQFTFSLTPPLQLAVVQAIRSVECVTRALNAIFPDGLFASELHTLSRPVRPMFLEGTEEVRNILQVPEQLSGVNAIPSNTSRSVSSSSLVRPSSSQDADSIKIDIATAIVVRNFLF